MKRLFYVASVGLLMVSLAGCNRGWPRNWPQPWTTPVGFYDGLSHGGFQTQDGSTALGVHDMAGNVSEWCADWFGVYTNPHNPPEVGILKIIRGGNWNKGSGSMQTWRRDHVRPEVPDFSVGFRTVVTVR